MDHPFRSVRTFLSCLLATATFLTVAVDARAQSLSQNCSPDGALKFLQKRLSGYISDKVLAVLMEGAADDLKRYNRIQNHVSGAAALAFLLMETQVDIVPTEASVQRRRIPRDKGGPNTYVAELMDKRHWEMLKAQLSIRHDPNLDWLNCFGIASETLFGQSFGISQAGPLGGVEVEWIIEDGADLIQWQRETKPWGITDGVGRTSMIVFAKATDRDLSQVCVVPWMRDASVRLRYKVKANDLNDLWEFTEQIVTLLLGELDSGVSLGLDLGSRAIWLYSRPVKFVVTDWQPCRWAVDMTATHDQSQDLSFIDTDEGRVVGTTTSSSRLQTTYRFTGEDRLSEHGSFDARIPVNQTGAVNGGSTTITRRSRKCATSTTVDSTMGAFPEVVAGITTANSEIRLEILPEDGVFHFSSKLLPLQQDVTRVFTAKGGCRGSVSRREAVTYVLGDSHFFPLQGDLDENRNEIEGTFVTSVKTAPGVSEAVMVTYRFTPLGQPARKGD